MIYINFFGLVFKFKFFFNNHLWLAYHQKNSQTLETPQHSTSIQSKVFKVKVFTPNIESYKSKYLPNLYSFQKDNGKQNIWDKMRLYWNIMMNTLGVCISTHDLCIW